VSRAFRVDTVTFTDDFDFLGFVRSVLAGEPVVGSLPTDSGHLDWWTRAWPLIRQSGYESRVADALNTSLTDPDSPVRASALAVLENHPELVSTETVERLLRDHSALFAGIKCPWQDSIDLEWMLLRLLGAKMDRSTDDGRKAIALGQRLVVSRPRTNGALAAGVTHGAPEWAAEHAVELAGGSVPTAVAILFNLHDRPNELSKAGTNLARVFGKDRRFRDELRRIVPDEQTRKAILSVQS
jgi:hypothetical protein